MRTFPFFFGLGTPTHLNHLPLKLFWAQNIFSLNPINLSNTQPQFQHLVGKVSKNRNHRELSAINVGQVRTASVIR